VGERLAPLPRSLTDRKATLGSVVSSRGTLVPITVHREETPQRLVSLQAFHRVGISAGILVEVSEKLSNLHGETLNLSREGVLVEVVHVCIIPQ
jgi:hypothetical protein